MQFFPCRKEQAKSLAQIIEPNWDIAIFEPQRNEEVTTKMNGDVCSKYPTRPRLICLFRLACRLMETCCSAFHSGTSYDTVHASFPSFPLLPSPLVLTFPFPF